MSEQIGGQQLHEVRFWNYCPECGCDHFDRVAGCWNCGAAFIAPVSGRTDQDEACDKAMDRFAELLELEWDGTLEGSDLKTDFIGVLTELFQTGRGVGIEEAAKTST